MRALLVTDVERQAARRLEGPMEGEAAMLGVKPNHAIWKRVNQAILNENAAEVIVTLLMGLVSLLVSAGVCADETQARAHLAAVLISPDTARKPGSLLPLLQAELVRLQSEGRTWTS